MQIHGGIGVTFEHDMHLYLRRLTLDRPLYGTPADHRQRLPRAGQAAGGGGVSEPQVPSPVEDVETFRRRAREWIHANLRQLDPSSLVGVLRNDRSDEEELRPSPTSAQSSACSSTPGWPASASPRSTGARG